MLIELLLLLKGYDIFSIFTALRVVESEVLINLESVALLTYLEPRKSGVNRGALRQSHMPTIQSQDPKFVTQTFDV